MKHEHLPKKYLILKRLEQNTSSALQRLLLRPKMEFCISAIAPALPQFNLSVVSSSPSLFKNDFLQSNNRLLFNPLKKLPVPSSRQLSFLQNPPHKLSSTWFMVSAAPSAVDSTVSDKLPADIQVTETPEPNSRVSFLFFVFFLHTLPLIVVINCSI